MSITRQFLKHSELDAFVVSVARLQAKMFSASVFSGSDSQWLI